MHGRVGMQGFSGPELVSTNQSNYMTAIDVSLACLSGAKSANAVEFKNKIISELVERIKDYSDGCELVEYHGYGRVRVLVKDEKQSQAVVRLYSRLIFELNSPVMINDCLVNSRACISVNDISEDFIGLTAGVRVNNRSALEATEYGAGCPDFFDVYTV